MPDTINNAVTIAIGASLSAALNVGEKIAVGILMPAGWDAAPLTFQAGVDRQTRDGALLDAPRGVHRCGLVPA